MYVTTCNLCLKGSEILPKGALVDGLPQDQIKELLAKGLIAHAGKAEASAKPEVAEQPVAEVKAPKKKVK